MKNTESSAKTGRMIGRLIEPHSQIPEERKRFTNQALRALIIPIIVEQFLALLVGIADTLMVSHAGEAAVSAVSLVNQLNNIFIMVFTALASGGAVVASQYIGSRDKKNGDMDSYDTVILIYPNWWGTLPQPVFTFLEEYDFSGKTIWPLCTHEGSRLGSSESDIAKLAPDAELSEGLEIRGSAAGSSQAEVEAWLSDLKISE